jgi:hypothetical protein
MFRCEWNALVGLDFDAALLGGSGSNYKLVTSSAKAIAQVLTEVNDLKKDRLDG